MVDTMSKSHSSWSHEHLAPQHAMYYPQEHQGHNSLRLPPPSSLVARTSTHFSVHGGREPAYKHGIYPSSHAASSPILQASPPLVFSGGQPNGTATSPHTRNLVEISARSSPALSSVSTDPLENHLNSSQHAPSGRDHYSAHSPRFPSQLQQTQQAPSEHHYPQIRMRAPYSENQSHDNHPALGSSSTMSHHHQPKPPRPEPLAAERMKISGILSGGEAPEECQKSSKSSSVSSPKRRIFFRQQPIAARSCGFGERDRRVIDPPPILQMTLDDSGLSPRKISSEIKHPFAVVHCTIWSSDGKQDCSTMSEEYRSTKRLMGTTVSSPFVGQDENNREGCFFCFPDLSVRTPGIFRLKFSLVVLSPTRILGAKTPVVATIMSEQFTVYNAKDFPGMQASTALTKKLKEQGCLISIKKGNEKNISRARGGSGSGEEDSDDDDDRSPRKKIRR